MPDEIALFIDFENIRYSLINVQRREPDPQELIALARRFGTVMVARAYADWSRQPEFFKGSLTAAMIDRVDCPAKVRERFRQNFGSPGYQPAYQPGYQPTAGAYPSGANNSDEALGDDGDEYREDTINDQRDSDDDMRDDETAERLDERAMLDDSESALEQRDDNDQSLPDERRMRADRGERSERFEGIGYPNGPYIPGGYYNNAPQPVITQSTVDLNMLMDIIETVFDRPNINTFILMSGDRDFTRICARLKLRLNKRVIVVGVPGTVSRDLISAAEQFIPLGYAPSLHAPSHPSPSSYNTPAPSAYPTNGSTYPSAGYNGASYNGASSYSNGSSSGYNSSNGYQGGGIMGQPYAQPMQGPVEPEEPGFIQFLDYIDRHWSWRTVGGVANFIGDPFNPKNRFRGRLTRESARDLLRIAIDEGILMVTTDTTGSENLRLNRQHPAVETALNDTPAPLR